MTILICMCEKAITNIKLKYALFLLGVNNHSHDTKRLFWKIEKTDQAVRNNSASILFDQFLLPKVTFNGRLPGNIHVNFIGYVHHKVCLEWPISGVPRVNRPAP